MYENSKFVEIHVFSVFLWILWIEKMLLFFGYIKQFLNQVYLDEFLFNIVILYEF